MCVVHGGAFVCDVGPGDMIDATIDDDDGDGVKNAVDNCRAKPNPMQENEDGDAEGDACDNCPPFVSDGRDKDGDGVGDLCDPRPSDAGDAIALFEGFNAMPAGWTATGMWSVADGKLVSIAQNTELSTIVVPYASTPDQTIYTSATITALTGIAGGSIGVVDRFDGDTGLHCGGGRTVSTGLLALIDAANGLFLDSVQHPFTVGTTYALRFDRAGKQYTCTDGAMSVMVDYDNAGPNIGFRNRVASAAFPWLMVVSSP